MSIERAKSLGFLAGGHYDARSVSQVGRLETAVGLDRFRGRAAVCFTPYDPLTYDSLGTWSNGGLHGSGSDGWRGFVGRAGMEAIDGGASAV